MLPSGAMVVGLVVGLVDIGVVVVGEPEGGLEMVGVADGCKVSACAIHT